MKNFLDQLIKEVVNFLKTFRGDPMIKTKNLNRRHFMATTAATSLILGAGRAMAAEQIKMAGIYTVPVE